MMRNMLIVVAFMCLLPNSSEAQTSREKRIKTAACIQELRVVTAFARSTISPMLYEDDGSQEFAKKFEFYYVTTLQRVHDILSECSNVQNDSLVGSVLFSLRNSGIIWKKPLEKRSAPGYHTPHDPVPGPGQ